MGTGKNAKSMERPELFGIELMRIPVLFDYKSMNAEYSYDYGEPDATPCEYCHYERNIAKYDSIVFRDESNIECDIFISTQELATIICNQRFREVATDSGLTNINFTPIGEYSFCDPTYDRMTVYDY